MQAVLRGQVEAAGVLLDAGANVNATDMAGLAPLMVAARKVRVQAAPLLLQLGGWAGDKHEDDTTTLSYAEAFSPGDFRTSLVALLTKAGTR